MTTLKPTRQQLTSWSKLNMAKYRHEEGLFLAEGLKVVQELLKSTYDTPALLILEEKKKHLESFLSTLPGHIEIYTLKKSEWKRFSQDSEPEGIMALVKMPHSEKFSPALEKGNNHLLLLYEVNNPSNLGAVMRTAHWFGIKTIVLSTNSVDFTNPKVVRSSMGSLFHLSIIPEVDFDKALPEFKKHYFLVGSTAQNGVTPHSCTYKTALLLGSESHGLPEKLTSLAAEQWYIPGTGGAESLSLAHAAAIMMYKMTQRGT
ncbi:MAG: RNA methyltransferase [Syntrophales bacterium]|nr:RNA methyltransferase [Syntrophales bacterium]